MCTTPQTTFGVSWGNVPCGATWRAPVSVVLALWQQYPSHGLKMGVSYGNSHPLGMAAPEAAFFCLSRHDDVICEG